jgi:hypothetical protein
MEIKILDKNNNILEKIEISLKDLKQLDRHNLIEELQKYKRKQKVYKRRGFKC